MSDLSPGDRVKPIQREMGDCLFAGPRVVQQADDGVLFIRCRKGRHYLDGHLLGEDDKLAGLMRA